MLLRSSMRHAPQQTRQRSTSEKVAHRTTCRPCALPVRARQQPYPGSIGSAGCSSTSNHRHHISLQLHNRSQVKTEAAASAAAGAIGSTTALLKVSGAEAQGGRSDDTVLRRIQGILLALVGLGFWCTLASYMCGATGLASIGFAVTNSSSKGLLVAQSAWTGLAAGVLHTLCGPDHLAALTPLTIGRGRAAATALGALWGFGHSTGQLILGLMFVCLKERFSSFAPALAKWSNTVIALTLIAIGVFGLYETHGAKEVEHELQLEVAGPPSSLPSSSPLSSPSHSHGNKGFTTYCTGIIYGLQPDALFVVIPALALPTKLAAIAYCAMFVTGTVTAMGGYTAVIGTTSAALSKDRPWLQAQLSTVASIVAICVGLFMLAASIAGLQGT